MKDLSECTILIVDDTETNIDILVDILGEEYDVAVAMDGESALEYVEEDPVPDLILLDIMMPGLDGYEVCSRLKASKKTRDIPVVFITAKAEVEDEIKGFDLGAVDYITKPLSPPRVRARIKAHLALKQARAMIEKQNEELKEAASLREDVDHIMRHDLKGPLGNIVGLSQIMLEDQDLDAEHVDDLTAIEESGYRILHMINLSLDLMKMERGVYPFQPVPVDLVKVVRKIITENKAIVQSKALKFVLTYGNRAITDSDTLFAKGEEILTYSMLSNLLKNAVEASPEGETIVFALDMSESEGASITLQNKGVVPEEIRNRFFDKYVSVGKSGGTGLGTYSAKLIAETQGGTIQMTTSASVGTTTITARLQPIIEEERKRYLFTSEEQKARGTVRDAGALLDPFGQGYLLIVDDDENNRTLLKKMLANTKLAIEFADNGETAFKKVCEFRYDLVVMDLEMPIMSGYDAIKKIRQWEGDHLKNSQSTKIVVLSAHDDQESINRCLEAGFDDYLLKPLSRSKLVETLCRCLPTGDIRKHNPILRHPNPKNQLTPQRFIKIRMTNIW